MSTAGITKISSVPGARRFQFDRHCSELIPYGPLLLYQIGDLSCDSQFQLGEHKQVCYEISYVVSGKGWFSVSGEREQLEAGDLYICRPGERHAGGVYSDDPFRYLYLGFHFHDELAADDPLQLVQSWISSGSSRVCHDRLDIRAPFVNALKELHAPSPFSQRMIQMYLEQIVVLTYRNFLTDWEVKYPGEGWENTTKRAVYLAIQYIDDRLLDIHDLKEVSDAFGYSYSHLSHLFSRETGESLRSYYAKRRWKKAIDLMEEGSYSMTEIAATLRYDSIHTFSRAFRNAFGMSPTQYMRKNVTNTPVSG